VNIKLPPVPNPVNHTVEEPTPTPTPAAPALAVWSSPPVVYLYLMILGVVWIIYILLNPSRRSVKHDVTDTLLVERSREQEATESHSCMCRRFGRRKQE